MTLDPVSIVTFVKDNLRGLNRARAAQAPPLTLLVVDDEELVRKHVVRVLNLAGIASVVANDGADALAKAKSLDRWPVLVTDLMMPGMSGDELARRLREQTPELKVLYLTGFVDRLFTERTVLWEDEMFLEKPFTSKGLLEAVALLITGHPSVEALAQIAAGPIA
jgi:two-component system, cell cycle sensor histidine kinase and response regulator CckA